MKQPKTLFIIKNQKEVLKMRCRTCSCELSKEQERLPIAALYLCNEAAEGLQYYCSAECLVEWIMTFAINHYGEKRAMSMLQSCK